MYAAKNISQANQVYMITVTRNCPVLLIIESLEQEFITERVCNTHMVSVPTIWTG